jgi:hypothetical protein
MDPGASRADVDTTDGGGTVVSPMAEKLGCTVILGAEAAPEGMRWCLLSMCMHPLAQSLIGSIIFLFLLAWGSRDQPSSTCLRHGPHRVHQRRGPHLLLRQGQA